VRYDTATRGVDVDLAALTGRGQGSDRFTAQQWVLVGSSYDDTLSGSGRDDHIVGGPGDDTLSGRGGHDILAPDRDYNGDYYTERNAGDDVVYGGTGDDTIDSYGGADRDHGGPGQDNVTDEGVRGVDRLFGGPGPDLLNDVLIDAAGQRMVGGNGRDLAYLGVHKLRGGKPIATAVTLDLRFGSGSLRWGHRRRAFTAARIEDLSAGDLPMGVTGAGGPWTVYGTGGANNLTVDSGGPATLYGRGGNDNLSGTPLSDRFYGGAGNDYAYPGRGRDLCVSVETINSFGGCRQAR
jgi:Ca2+-binding RTX toxin-like protein